MYLDSRGFQPRTLEERCSSSKRCAPGSLHLPTALCHSRFGSPPSEWHQFCSTCGQGILSAKPAELFFLFGGGRFRMGKSSKSQAQLKLFLGSTLCKESAMDDSSGHLVHHCSPQRAFDPILEAIIAETSLLELLLHRRAALYSLLDISLERNV